VDQFLFLSSIIPFFLRLLLNIRFSASLALLSPALAIAFQAFSSRLLSPLECRILARLSTVARLQVQLFFDWLDAAALDLRFSLNVSLLAIDWEVVQSRGEI
jgi:hypothetical protein